MATTPANATTVHQVATLFGVVTEDLNGECFIVGAEGEVEEHVDTNIIYVPHGMAVATNQSVGNMQVHDQDQVAQFVLCNMAVDLPAGVNRTLADRAKIAYIRYLAVRNGLASPDFDPAANNVKYNHTERLSEARTQELETAGLASTEIKTAIQNTLTGPYRKLCRRMFMDCVCCIAYIFRVRGHHYKDDFQTRYDTLWSRCLHTPADLPLQWNYLATDALHAVMPVHLDAIWADCVTNARCAGALIKRFDAAPAGVAGVFALKRGLDDVMMIFPGVVNNIPDAYRSFVQMFTRLKQSRWGGSINARYYGAQRIRVDEGSIGALASVVMGVYDQLASDSKLRESPALARLAQTAPATGGAIGLAARNATSDRRLNLLDMVPSVEVPGVD